MSLYKNKFRVESSRAKEWDYTSDGYYFVTICVKNKSSVFGENINGKIKLSEIGKIAKQYWLEIPKHFPFVELDVFIIMPDHIHGIIIINNTVETQNLASLPNRFGPQSKNLGSIIRGFKIGVKKYCQNNHKMFDWQSRFYDHIIWHEQELINVRQYIINNPLKNHLDNFHDYPEYLRINASKKISQ